MEDRVIPCELFMSQTLFYEFGIDEASHDQIQYVNIYLVFFNIDKSKHVKSTTQAQ